VLFPPLSLHKSQGSNNPAEVPIYDSERVETDGTACEDLSAWKQGGNGQEKTVIQNGNSAVMPVSRFLSYKLNIGKF